MDYTDTVKMTIELGIDASRIIQQVQIRNEHLEDQIEKGITQALNEISNEETLVDMIRKSTKDAIERTVNDAIISWEVRQKIKDAIEGAIGEKLTVYADEIAKKITDGFI